MGSLDQQVIPEPKHRNSPTPGTQIVEMNSVEPVAYDSCSLLHQSCCSRLNVALLVEQVDKLRRAQIIEREWKGAETEELKGALDAARKALKASRKA